MIHFIRLFLNLILSVLTSPHRHHQQISELPNAERRCLVADRVAQPTAWGCIHQNLWMLRYTIV